MCGARIRVDEGINAMEQRSPEWFAARKGRITASIVGAILGLSPYMTRNDAMRLLVREREGAEREFTGNVATQHGEFHEDGAAMEFEMETGLGIEKIGFVPFEDWAGVSPDGFVNDGGGLEIKCPFGIRNDPEPVFKTLADQPHYEAQVQFSLYVTGKPHWHFWQWTPHGRKHEVIYPDKDWQGRNIPILRQFHAEFLDEAADDHIAPKRIEIDTPEAHKMIAEWDEISEQLERATERKKDLLEQMIKAAGEKNALFAGRKLTLTKRDGAVSYAKAIKELLPKADLSKWKGKPSEFWQVR